MHKFVIGEAIYVGNSTNHSTGFTTGGNIGELTIPTGTLDADNNYNNNNNYSVEVCYSEVGNFPLKAGNYFSK